MINLAKRENIFESFQSMKIFHLMGAFVIILRSSRYGTKI